MYTVIITGGIGSGKSTASRYLQELGATRISLDEVSHELLEHSQTMRDQIIGAFGREVLDESGRIVPAKLASRAFATPHAQKTLNAITFPHIISRTREMIDEMSHNGSHSHSQVLVIEVPLLIEAPEFAELADETIAVIADRDTRIERAVRRGGSRDDIQAREALQATDDERISLCDTVICNNGSMEELKAKLDAWWKKREQSDWVR